MNNLIELIQNNISSFDVVVLLIILYSTAQSTAKGFIKSLLYFSKWFFALIITIILFPKLSPLVQNILESKFFADIGLSLVLYVISLFVINVIAKVISKTLAWSGLGIVDKTFGLIFGILKGYIICVCIFSLINWFYPHQKWPIETDDTYSFIIIYKGSKFLIKELPNRKDYYKDTEEKIENI